MATARRFIIRLMGRTLGDRQMGLKKTVGRKVEGYKGTIIIVAPTSTTPWNTATLHLSAKAMTLRLVTATRIIKIR